MGLDTSHDCWHGPYSSFMAWREWLHGKIHNGKNPDLHAAWDAGDYADQSVPTNVLMNHSDCDGEIPAEVCGPLADALQAIADKARVQPIKDPPRCPYDLMMARTEQFIAGLRAAAAANEPVEFH